MLGGYTGRALTVASASGTINEEKLDGEVCQDLVGVYGV